MRYLILSTLVLLSIFVFVEAQVQMMGPQQFAQPEIEQGMFFFLVTVAFVEFKR